MLGVVPAGRHIHLACRWKSGVNSVDFEGGAANRRDIVKIVVGIRKVEGVKCYDKDVEVLYKR